MDVVSDCDASGWTWMHHGLLMLGRKSGYRVSEGDTGTAG